jgi:hypothetical protein
MASEESSKNISKRSAPTVTQAKAEFATGECGPVAGSFQSISNRLNFKGEAPRNLDKEVGI